MRAGVIASRRNLSENISTAKCNVDIATDEKSYASTHLTSNVTQALSATVPCSISEESALLVFVEGGDNRCGTTNLKMWFGVVFALASTVADVALFAVRDRRGHVVESACLRQIDASTEHHPLRGHSSRCSSCSQLHPSHQFSQHPSAHFYSNPSHQIHRIRLHPSRALLSASVTMILPASVTVFVSSSVVIV